MNLKKIENPFGGMVYYKKSTTSTMAEAAALLEEENIHGSLVITDDQTNGVGRIPGRVWASEPYKNLTFTLILDRDKVGHGFWTTPLKAGVALAEVVGSFLENNQDPKVKWPNDVLVNGKKISGILCHSSKGYILMGVGINVNQISFNNEITEKTTSLSLLTDKGFSLEMILSNFLKSFYGLLNSDEWLTKLNNNLYKQGEDVTFRVGNPENNNLVKGKLIGLDDQGKILIEDDKGLTTGYLSGEFI